MKQVNVIRDGKLFTVESADICRGDLIKVEAGELVRPYKKKKIVCGSSQYVLDKIEKGGVSAVRGFSLKTTTR